MRCGNLSWKTLTDYGSHSISEKENNTLSSASFVLAAHVPQPQHTGNRTTADKRQPNSWEPGRRMKSVEELGPSDRSKDDQLT